MNQRLKLQQNNEGFSLVELIVTILISSVVMLAVVGLLTTGLNLYKSVSAETLLQTEGQAATGRINELVQEAQYLQFYSNDGANDSGCKMIPELVDNKVLLLMTNEDGGDGWWYYIVWDEGEKLLLLTKDEVERDADNTITNIPSTDDIKEKARDMISVTQKKKYLLAQYIDNFIFRKMGTEKLYKVDILLATDNKQFSASQFISERNK